MSDFEILMNSYENLAENDLVLALENMVILYFSNNNLSHEISDSIELWVFEKGDTKLLKFINELSDKDNRLLGIAREGLNIRFPTSS